MSPFYPNQIVCLPCQNHFLYSEVIQVIPERQSLWVRPLWLVFGNNLSSIDVHGSSDLILPIDLFRLALDTEVIPLLSDMLKDNSLDSSHDYLQSFVKQVWQENPDYFKKKL